MSTSLKYLAYLIGSSKTISYLARHGWLKPALQSWIDKHVGGRGFEELAQSESLTPDLQAELDQAVRLLNNRPRKRLNWQTPAQVFKA